MSIGPVVRRQWVVTGGRGEAFRERVIVAGLAGGAVLALFVLWDRKGWDRGSVYGALVFGHAAFGLVAAVQLALAFACVLPGARAVAAERDKKTLDALLASRLPGG